MNDRGLSILSQYGLKAHTSYRGRGSLICETDQGLKLIKEYNGSKIKLEFQGRVLNHLREAGFTNIDVILANQEEALISLDRDEIPYIVKDWYTGKECDTKNRDNIIDAVKVLAKIHNLMVLPHEEDEVYFLSGDLITEYEKHNRELKRVRNFIKDKRRKNDFELCFMRDFQMFFEQAENVLALLKGSDYEILQEVSLRNGTVCHGEYNYHNILFLDVACAVTNFDRCLYGIQMNDLYHFMRKVLEKTDWDEKTGVSMVEAYDKVRTIGKDEMEYLYLRLCYPEKFWKVANHYFNSNKAWIPGKNVEKVKSLVCQQEVKEKFLKNIK